MRLASHEPRRLGIYTTLLLKAVKASSDSVLVKKSMFVLLSFELFLTTGVSVWPYYICLCRTIFAVYFYVFVSMVMPRPFA